MRRRLDRERGERFGAYLNQLPVETRGALLVALWVNAVATLALDAAWLILAARVLRRFQTGRGPPWEVAVDVVRSRDLAGVAGATAVHWMGRAMLVRVLDARVRGAVSDTPRSQEPGDVVTDHA